MDVEQWLHSIGLAHYEAAFRENAIDATVLPNLTAEDLKDLGVFIVGHRRKMLSAIAGLGAAPASDATAQPESPAPQAPAAEAAAERRQLTVLFCDLVGSTALSVRLDPEDMREVVRAYQDCCARVIASYDGLVAKYMGDGVLAYFGFPRAHEDDAERAVRAGLELADAVAQLKTRAPEPLLARIGVATGVVVVGDLVGEGSSQERAVVGDTPNLAARLQARAGAGGVLISDLTRRLIGDAFEVNSLGPQEMKGFDAPVGAWAVLREARAESRFEATRSGRMTEFVGREPEVALLVERWRDASAGEGKVALLSGEPGIGKSRILAQLRERIADEPHVTVRYQCSPHHMNDAFYPILNQIWRAAEFVDEEPSAARLDKLEALARRSRLEPRDVVPFVASLNAIPFEDRYGRLEMTLVEQKERLMTALLALFEGLTGASPVLALLEDAHWIDPSSLELFSRLIARASRLRALLIVTFRPDFVAPWLGPGHVHALTLSRLGRRHAHALIDQVAGGKSLPVEVINEIVAKTDGVPLFIEELTKTVLESGLLREEKGSYVLASSLTPLAIPSTLQDSLMARLDRLAPVKEVAQLGAAIGREFAYSLLEAVSPIRGELLQQALTQLMAAGLVFGHGTPPDATYTFKHALVQDTAYATLLKSRKQRLHQQIAETLRDLFPERAEREPGVVALHFTRAGLDEAAIGWWERAGERAVRRFANREAIESYVSGLKMIFNLPAGEARDRRELAFRLALGPALLADRGYASEEVERNSVATSRLAEALQDAEAAFTSARGLWHYHYDRSELDRALTLAARLVALASHDVGGEKKSLALRAVGSTLMNKAEFARAIDVFERCIAESAAAPLGASLARHGEEPLIVSLQYKGLSLTVRGFPEAGLAAALEALSLAQRLNYPLMETFASNILANVLILRRDYASCVSLVRAQIEFCARHNLSFWSAAHEILHGAATACGGDPTGLTEVEAGIRTWRQTGAELHVPTWSTYLADGALRVGALDVAERALTDGADACAKHGENFALAELRRLVGLLVRQRNRPSEARRALEEAVDIARRQGAGLFLLRAGRDLARVLADDGDKLSALELLRPIIDGVSEFRDGIDFQEAIHLQAALLT